MKKIIGLLLFSALISSCGLFNEINHYDFNVISAGINYVLEYGTHASRNIHFDYQSSIDANLTYAIVDGENVHLIILKNNNVIYDNTTTGYQYINLY